MTYRFSLTGVPHNHLKLKMEEANIVIGNVLHQYIVNGKMVVVKYHTRRCLCVAEMERGGREITTYSRNRIKFQFSFHAVTNTRKKFPERRAFPVQYIGARGVFVQNSGPSPISISLLANCCFIICSHKSPILPSTPQGRWYSAVRWDITPNDGGSL